jgi:hypothetical protein
VLNTAYRSANGLVKIPNVCSAMFFLSGLHCPLSANSGHSIPLKSGKLGVAFGHYRTFPGQN